MITEVVKRKCVIFDPLSTGQYAEASRITGISRSVPLQNFSSANIQFMALSQELQNTFNHSMYSLF